MDDHVYTYSAGSHEDYHVQDSRLDVPPVTSWKGKKYIPGSDGRDFEMMAEHCAEQWHSNHDGWEATWPVEFRVYEDDIEVGRFSVDREYVPHFYGNALPFPEPSP